MKRFKFILRFLIIIEIALLMVSCNQATETQEVADAIESPPTQTSLPPTPTAMPPTETQVPPTETEVLPTTTNVPPTKTPTSEPINLTEVAFTASDLLGTWILEARPDTGMILEVKNICKYFEKEGSVGIGAYDLNGDVVTFTDYDCIKLVGGVVQMYTCSADYKVTFYKDDNDQAYLTFELIGEDEHTYRKWVTSFVSLWIKVE